MQQYRHCLFGMLVPHKALEAVDDLIVEDEVARVFGYLISVNFQELVKESRSFTFLLEFDIILL